MSDVTIPEAEVVRASNAEDDGKVIGYMCLIDFEWELGAASGGSKVYPSIEDLKEHHDCWAGCGIVEVRVAFHSVIVPEPDHALSQPNEEGEGK